jgi:uncharacterized membrane-anchored protein
MFDWIEGAVTGLMRLLTILFILVICGFVYFVYHFFFYDHHTFKSKTPPSINYELKARDKTVDTVWIYHFD